VTRNLLDRRRLGARQCDQRRRRPAEGDVHAADAAAVPVTAGTRW